MAALLLGGGGGDGGGCRGRGLRDISNGVKGSGVGEGLKTLEEDLC